MTQRIVSISHFNCNDTLWRRDEVTGRLAQFQGAPYCRSCARRSDVHKYISVTDGEFNPDSKVYKEMYRCRPCLDAILPTDKPVKAAADSSGTYDIISETEIKKRDDSEKEYDWR